MLKSKTLALGAAFLLVAAVAFGLGSLWAKAPSPSASLAGSAVADAEAQSTTPRPRPVDIRLDPTKVNLLPDAALRLDFDTSQPATSAEVRAPRQRGSLSAPSP